MTTTDATSRGTNEPQRSLRLSTRIYLGTAVLVGLFLVSVVIAWIGFRNVRGSLDEFSAASRFATSAGEIDHDALAIRQYVLSFTFGGNDSDADRVMELAGILDERISDTLDTAPTEETRDHLDRMRTHLGTYRTNFATVVEERGLRDELIASRIVGPADEVEEMLNAIVDDADEPASDRGLSPEQARGLLSNISLAEISVLQFVNDPDAGRVREGLVALRGAITRLETLRADDPRPIHDRLLARLREFEAGFLRSVQATRGYLFLAHVVMAGEASEFAYHSSKVRELAAERLAAINEGTVATAERSTNLVLLVSLVAVLLGVLVSFGIVRRVVQPIAQITRTFNTLSQGEVVESVPGLDRGDEIGEMARAADVFRDRNRQTVELLAEARHLAEELDSRADQLAKSNRDLDSFAYVASHDLKSPLRGIDNLAQWILEDAEDTLPEESRRHLEMLRERVGRMERLLDDLLAYSRAGRERAATTEVDTVDLIDEIRETIDWPDEMQLDVAAELPTIETVRVTLQRVFHNLLTNAVKYRTHDATPHVAISSRDADDELVEFSVADNGIGIAPEYHARVFEMFKRLHAQDEIEGSGMGLALVKRLVESAGGEIHVESAEGEGATFRFTWPRETVAAEVDEESALPAAPV